MANYFLTETAQFKPFSYQEMLAPIMALKEDYEKTEKELSDLEDTAAAQAFTFQGSAYENDYNKYIESLNNASNNMSIGNYNSDTKNQIKALRKQFLNTLAPAAQRITKLNTLRDKQNAEQAANPYIRFSTDYRNANEKDITANSNYTSYDLSKIYKQIAEDTLNRIATNYRPQVGDPINIEGTNSYIVKHGYGMTPEEYEGAISNHNSDLNKYINSEINKAVKGITNEDVIKEVTQGVKDVIKSNIGKFESTTVKSSNSSESNANFFRAAEHAYKYKWEKDANGNLIITGLSDQYKLDHGWKINDNGELYKPGGSDDDTYYYDHLNQDPNAGYENQIPSFKGGEARIKRTKLDTKLKKLGKDRLKIKEVNDAFGNPISDVQKFSYDEIVSTGVEDIEKELKKLTEGNPLAYYDFYYSDSKGIGGTLYSVRKSNEDIKTLLNDAYIADLKEQNKHKGVIRLGDDYYYIDSNGKFLLDKNKKRIKLDFAEIERYTKENIISKNTPSGEKVFFNQKKSAKKEESKNNTSQSSAQTDSTAVAPKDTTLLDSKNIAVPF